MTNTLDTYISKEELLNTPGLLTLQSNAFIYMNADKIMYELMKQVNKNKVQKQITYIIGILKEKKSELLNNNHISVRKDLANHIGLSYYTRGLIEKEIGNYDIANDLFKNAMTSETCTEQEKQFSSFEINTIIY